MISLVVDKTGAMARWSCVDMVAGESSKGGRR